MAIHCLYFVYFCELYYVSISCTTYMGCLQYCMPWSEWLHAAEPDHCLSPDADLPHMEDLSVMKQPVAQGLEELVLSPAVKSQHPDFLSLNMTHDMGEFSWVLLPVFAGLFFLCMSTSLSSCLHVHQLVFMPARPPPCAHYLSFCPSKNIVHMLLGFSVFVAYFIIVIPKCIVDGSMCLPLVVPISCIHIWAACC